MGTAAPVRQAAERYVERHGMRAGTHPENVAAMYLHRMGLPFVQQYRVGRYHLDFALPQIGIAIEVDGPHHQRPDVAHQDAVRDERLRRAGWVVLRVAAGDDEQILAAGTLARLALDDPAWPARRAS